MADVSFTRFAILFSARLAGLGYSLRRAERQWPKTDRAMLSRAVNGKTLSAGNYLLLCQMAGLDPYDCFDDAPRRRATLQSIGKSFVDPTVTADATRETTAEGEDRPREAKP